MWKRFSFTKFKSNFYSHGVSPSSRVLYFMINSPAFTLATIISPVSSSLKIKESHAFWSLLLGWLLHAFTNFSCPSLYRQTNFCLAQISEPFSIICVFLYQVCSLSKEINVISANSKICGIFKWDKTNCLTYALSDPHRMLVVSGYAGITRQAMHGSHRLPDLVRDEGK